MPFQEISKTEIKLEDKTYSMDPEDPAFWFWIVKLGEAEKAGKSEAELADLERKCIACLFKIPEDVMKSLTVHDITNLMGLIGIG